MTYLAVPYGSVSHKAADDYVNKSLTAIRDAFARSTLWEKGKARKVSNGQRWICARYFDARAEMFLIDLAKSIKQLQ